MKENTKSNLPNCVFSGPGRGDCEHFIGLPGKSIPNQHDGRDDTVDVYGKPNGWCWWCWKQKQIDDLNSKINNLKNENLKWAHNKYQEQVDHRPNVNIYKSTLHHVWRQVIEHFGGAVT